MNARELATRIRAALNKIQDGRERVTRGELELEALIVTLDAEPTKQIEASFGETFEKR